MMKMEDIRRYVIEEPEALRRDCIEKGWFTCGSSRQYDKLFAMNEIINGFELQDIAVVIWVCSDNSQADSGFWAIRDYLEEAQEDYLENLQLQVNAANEPTESEWLENIARR